MPQVISDNKMRNITHGENSTQNRVYILILIFLILSGIILRFYRLNFDSLWLDEACTHTFAQDSFLGIWQTTFMKGEFNPPLFYWIEHVMLYFGDSEFVLRFIPAVVGVLIIPIFYLVGTEFRDKSTGLLSATLVAFSPFNVYYSQEARAYTLVLILFSIAFLFYLKTMRSENATNWILFGAFSAIAFWTHFYVFVPIGLLYLHSMIINSRKIRENVISIRNLGISVLIFCLLAFPLILKAINMFFVRTSSAPTYGMKGISLITQTLTNFSGYNKLAVGIFMLLFFIGLVFLIIMDNKKSLLIIYLVFSSLLISYILAAKMPMMPRYLIFLFPAFFLGAASSYNAFYSIAKKQKIIYFLIILIIVINVPYFSSYYSGFHKEDWREFSKNLQQMTNKDDIIVVLPGYIRQPLDYYYDNKSDQTYEYEASNSLELQKIYIKNKGHQIFYVVTSDINAANPEGDAIKWLQNNTHFLKKDTNIFLFKSSFFRSQS